MPTKKKQKEYQKTIWETEFRERYTVGTPAGLMWKINTDPNKIIKFFQEKIALIEQNLIIQYGQKN